MAKILLEYPDEMQQAVDQARGDVPRNAWIRRAIEARLGDAPVRTPEPTPSKQPPPIERTAVDEMCPKGWKQRPGSARCFNCGRGLSQHG